jgi:hypothetical protein
MFISHILKSATLKKWLIGGIAAIICVPLLVLCATYFTPILPKTNFIITQNQVYFTVFRWIVLIIFYLAWPWLVQKRSDQCAWTERKTEFWLQQKFRVMMWLIVFEILICENILWKLMIAI